jgi:hypothetical protein
MPPGKYMSSGNLGDGDMVQINILSGTLENQDTVVCEPGWDKVCRGRSCRFNTTTESPTNETDTLPSSSSDGTFWEGGYDSDFEDEHVSEKGAPENGGSRRLREKSNHGGSTMVPLW